MSDNVNESQIIEIPIDDLGIDSYNVRKSPWNHDENLIGSIKARGIDVPLLVRPSDPSTGVKFSVIQGSRRYNAAIDAGLKKVPCRIKVMNDFEAAISSFDENFNRDEPPNWQFALQIGIIANFLEGTPVEKRKMLKKHTGLSEETIDKYLAVSELPEEIIELLKKPEERSNESIKLLKELNIDKTTKPLSLEKAALISKKLKGIELSKQLEVAAHIITIPIDDAIEIVKRIKTYPFMNMDEITKKVTEIPKGRSISCFYSAQILQGLDEAAVKLNRDIKTLIVSFVEEALIKRGFLK